jgi:NAD(P)-dependent dehydrogenase (short-subunit alcohol dehydrogenase family)
MKQLQDRVAIVTGASSGIGKAIAENFAAEGAKTVLVARRKEVLDGIVAEIRGKGGAAEAAAADVTKEADVDALFAKVVKGTWPGRHRGQQRRSRRRNDSGLPQGPAGASRSTR